ncbi:protein-methionine-sulfoxide reductase catalytic subunit MsrP [Lusitaniella coriacea LEGE 07157]|uniref:Protein-methionine-sulfoxide reductase catalytic subunit MsrP n=1 Tax=Lusitaniella coriacea LEGE 07157 TaxID=945747 RepID=A0A8J7B811_9CYAN|nr:protein-methionine-sulfoxide reductase catalytic subunit MsrP [Lusitaniella coriacea]MBE9114910.1 protein-methionine-sulfoxide reductase catalytic subunit MsrP [Lusitaniella coriacea LEGE 07157]
MAFIHIPPSWQLPESKITAERLYFNRRRFIKTLVGAGIGASLLPLAGCKKSQAQLTELEATYKNLSTLEVTTNPTFASVERPTTDRILASSYNNFYEFGGTKSIWQAAQKLPTEDWKVEVTGLVRNPQTYDLEDIQKNFPLEERTYRFRCVEAWSMVLPWIGFPMKSLLAAVEPTEKAKFIRFTSFYDPKITSGPGFSLSTLPWPYTESLRIEEMANDLAFFAVGIYGQTLPKQHGAPIRAVLPWKYGFKGAKSIVKIEFLEEQPATYWNTIVPSEYDFEANVNPDKPHPRWSQAREKFIAQGPDLSWEWKETLPYNGYGEFVASLYS